MALHSVIDWPKSQRQTMAQRLGCHSVAKQALIIGKVYLS